MRILALLAALALAAPAHAFSTTRCTQSPITGSVTCTTSGSGTFSTTRCTRSPLTGTVTCSTY